DHVCSIAVVALLAGADLAVAADVEGTIELAGGVVAVARAVVAFLAGPDLAVAARKLGRHAGDIDHALDAAVAAGGRELQRRGKHARVRATSPEVLPIHHLFHSDRWVEYKRPTPRPPGAARAWAGHERLEREKESAPLVVRSICGGSRVSAASAGAPQLQAVNGEPI